MRIIRILPSEINTYYIYGSTMMSVDRSSSDMFAIGRITCRREGTFFLIENALSVGKGGWECTARATYAICDCRVLL